MSTKAAVQAEVRRQAALVERKGRRISALEGQVHILRGLLVEVLAANEDLALGRMVRDDIRAYLLRNHREPSALDIGLAENRERLEAKYLHRSEVTPLDAIRTT